MKGRKNPKLSPRRKYKRYTPEQLRWAVNYMRKEKTTAGKAAKAAEKQFDLPADTIPKSTIWHYSHNPNRQIGKRPGVGTVLSGLTSFFLLLLLLLLNLCVFLCAYLSIRKENDLSHFSYP